MPTDTTMQTKWDLSQLLESDTDPQVEQIIAESQKAYQDFVAKWQTRSDYLEAPQILKEALDEYEALARNYDGTGSVGYYFELRYCQNQSNPQIKAQNNKIRDTEVKMVNEVEFFTNRLCKILPKTQILMLSYPELKPYRHFLEKLFESAKYTLSEPEEKNIKS